jgi:hypothetical protein
MTLKYVLNSLVFRVALLFAWSCFLDLVASRVCQYASNVSTLLWRVELCDYLHVRLRKQWTAAFLPHCRRNSCKVFQPKSCLHYLLRVSVLCRLRQQIPKLTDWSVTRWSYANRRTASQCLPNLLNPTKPDYACTCPSPPEPLLSANYTDPSGASVVGCRETRWPLHLASVISTAGRVNMFPLMGVQISGFGLCYAGQAHLVVLCRTDGTTLYTRIGL